MSLSDFTLINKTILLISPQGWGPMFLSKHHYAIELAKKGNTVYFLNPPGEGHNSKKSVRIAPLPDADGLYLVTQQLFFPYNLKFHAIGVFHWLMKWQIKKIIKTIGVPIDILWSFDLNNNYPFRFFRNISLKIFHPVDEPLTQASIDSAEGSDIIFSVTREILQKYETFSAPKHFINHGLSGEFLNGQSAEEIPTAPVRVGLSGNWLRQDIDKVCLLRIVRENPEVQFEFWGSYSLSDTNIGGALNAETATFLNSLQSCSNVHMHGVVSSKKLAAEYHRMHAFLICYDVEKDQSKGTNYHKIMEYISTGRIIVSNNITTYSGSPDLAQMVMERKHNNQLPVLFKEVIKNLGIHNTLALQQKRQQFARDNSYARQIQRVEEILRRPA